MENMKYEKMREMRQEKRKGEDWMIIFSPERTKLYTKIYPCTP